MTHGNPVLCLHEIGLNGGIHRVVAPRFLEDILGTIGNILPDAAPDPSQVDSGVPYSRLIYIRVSVVVRGEGRGLGTPVLLDVAVQAEPHPRRVVETCTIVLMDKQDAFVFPLICCRRLLG